MSVPCTYNTHVVEVCIYIAWSRGYYGCCYSLCEPPGNVSKKDSLSDKFCIHEGILMEDV